MLKWGNYWVAHIHQVETGAYKDMGASRTVSEALKHFTPNVIISLGVAFEIDFHTQNIGDVIVSKRILPYSENKRDEDKIKPDRSQDKTIDRWLHVRLTNANGFLDSVTYGDILTGGPVLSSFEEKDKICLGYTKADFVVGGEMEGNALFQNAKSDGIPAIVIKGICDWGVAKNDIYPGNPWREEKFKDSLQAFAMINVVEKCMPIFYDGQLFFEPKNINFLQLKRKYTISKWCLLISQAIMLFYGAFRIIAIIGGELPLLIRELMNNPLIWIVFPLFVFCIVFANSDRKAKVSKRITDRELEDSEFNFDTEPNLEI